MSGTIDFQHDTANDIVVVTPHWTIDTPADIASWSAQWGGWFEQHRPGQKTDVVIVLHDFRVNKAVAVAWGAARAILVERYMRHSFRVDANSVVSFYVNTSGAKYNAATQEAASIADAITGILHARERRPAERSRPTPRS